MLFNSLEFVFGFVPITFLGFFLAGRIFGPRYAIGWLVLASLVFYGWFHLSYLLLLLFSLAFNYSAGWWLGESQQTEGTQRRRLVLSASIGVNLALIGYFKYMNFFVDTVSTVLGKSWSVGEVLLPIGISFFTFQQIAYLVDRYQEPTRNPDFLDYSLFISFFPQLVAGPIVHHKDVLPQFRDERIFRFNSAVFFSGLTVFFLGLFKKVVLADQFAVYADRGFNAAADGTVLTFFEAWGASLSYTFQLYFDFSGYSDMALGLAGMVGIQLPLNFFSPYKATSIIDFWRRWHMTLSRFLRDYLYIPLGGNRHGPLERYRNLFITMLLGGLWHGAGWTFVLWGALHGLYLIANHAWIALMSLLPGRGPSGPLYDAFGWCLTFAAVVIGWVFFRAADLPSALLLLEGMAGMHGAVLPSQVLGVLPWLAGLVRPAGSVAYLADGTVLGLGEMVALLVLAFAVVLGGRTLPELSSRSRSVLLCLTFAFTLQRIVFKPEAAQFIYFQF